MDEMNGSFESCVYVCALSQRSVERPTTFEWPHPSIKLTPCDPTPPPEKIYKIMSSKKHIVIGYEILLFEPTLAYAHTIMTVYSKSFESC